MPVPPSSVYAPVSDCADLVRALCNDQTGSLFTDVYILPFMNAAYRDVQIALANAGKQTFTADYATLSVPAVATADPGQEIQISFTGTTGNVSGGSLASPVLPSDLIEPEVITERQDGSADPFQQMQNMTAHGGLPSYPQEGALRFWEWREDSICLLGATQQIQIKIRYSKGLAPFSTSIPTGTVNTSGQTVTFATGSWFTTGASWTGQTIMINGVSYTVLLVQSNTSLIISTSAGTQTGVTYQGPPSFSGNIGILNATNAIGYSATALALTPRGSPLAAGYAAQGEAYKDALITSENRQQQYSSYRRKPFSGRKRAVPFSW